MAGSTLIIICITIFATALRISMAKSIPKVPALYLFGDSLLDAGTNNYVNSSTLANFPPYGETYFHIATGRFTDGRTVGDFLAQALHLPLVRPYVEPGDHKYGANFASAGSGLLDSTGSEDGVVPLKQQIRQFQELAAKVDSDNISKSMFIMSTGGNDMSAYLSNATVATSEFLKSLMKTYEESVLAMYKAGAKKFVLIESGTLGCTPSARLSASSLNQTGCLNAGNQLALAFNTALGNLTKNLTSTLQDATLLHAKVFNHFTDLINNGEQYGFSSTINACCGGGLFNAYYKCGKENSSTCQFPSQSLFWDFTHPTEAAYKSIFKQLWRGNSSYIEPFNIYTLASN